MAQFDDLFRWPTQRRGLREYLAGLLAPRDRNKTLTALAEAEPVTGAQHPAVQRLQFFLSEGRWDHERVNAHRLELLLADPATAPHATSPAAIASTAWTPWPSMALAPPFEAFGAIRDWIRAGSSSPPGIPPCWPTQDRRRRNWAVRRYWLKKAAARRAISSAGTSSMCWLIIHCWPNGSRSRPPRSP